MVRALCGSMLLMLLLQVLHPFTVFSRQSPLLINRIDVAQGLPQSFISGIVQDSRGFMWIGSREGLARYDGRKFKLFNHVPGDSATAAGNIVSGLYAAGNDLFWVCYEQGDLDIFNAVTETFIHLGNEKPYRPLVGHIAERSSLTRDAAGKYWLLLRGSRLCAIDLQRKKMEQFSAAELIPGKKLQTITGIIGAGKYLVVYTDKGILWLTPQRTIARERDFPVAELTGIPDSKGRYGVPLARRNGDLIRIDSTGIWIYLAASDSLIRIPLPRKQQRYIIIPACFDSKDNLYFGYDGEIYLLHSDNKLEVWRENKENPDHIGYTTTFRDRSGVLWMGTNGSGIEQYDLRLQHISFRPYRKSFREDVLESAGITPQALQATYIPGMNAYTFRWLKDKKGAYWISMSSMTLDRSNDLIVIRDGKARTFHWKYYPGGQTADFGIDALAISRAGKLWGINGLLQPVLFDTLTGRAGVRPAIIFPSMRRERLEINGLLMDNESDCWISGSMGLIRYSLDHKKGTLYFHNRDMQLLCMRQDPFVQHILWIGTRSGGLIRFDKRTGRYRCFTRAQGLPDNTVYAMLPDNAGNLWCSSNHGIFTFNLHSKEAQGYDMTGGRSVMEFNRYHALALPDGRLSFGGPEGYIVFDPAAVTADDYEPATFLTGILINNGQAAASYGHKMLRGPVDTLSVLKLPYDQNFLEFEFAALEFNMPGKISYRYRLLGLDKDWVMAGNDNVATYTAIPPGRYTLLINATNTVGRWSTRMKRLELIITPPFWRTWWFSLMIVLLLAALVWLLLRKRLRDAQRKYREKLAYETEIIRLEEKALRSQMNPHFIFNCLNSIKALIREGRNEEAVVYLNTFSRLIRHQLNNNQSEISLYEELETCRLYLQLEALRFQDQVRYEFMIDPDIDPNHVAIPPLIIQPFIENAVIHGILPLGREGSIVIGVAKKEGAVLCSIEDNGVGRNAAAHGSGDSAGHVSRATGIVKNRLDLYSKLHDCESSMTIIDKKDTLGQPSGTLVQIILPIC